MIADPEGPPFITRTVGRRRYADDASVSHDPQRSWFTRTYCDATIASAVRKLILWSRHSRRGVEAPEAYSACWRRRGSAPIPLVNLNGWLKPRHTLRPNRRRSPAPTALTGRTALQDGWHGDAPAAIRHPQVERRA